MTFRKLLKLRDLEKAECLQVSEIGELFATFEEIRPTLAVATLLGSGRCEPGNISWGGDPAKINPLVELQI